MRVRYMLRMLLAVLLATGILARFALALDGPEPAPAEPPGIRSLEPQAPLKGLFPTASHIAVGVAILPDPRVPRYRRLYDLAIVAIELGMLEEGYVLDNYSLPWVSTDAKQKTHKEPYGLLVFRCDTWRTSSCAGKPERDDRTRIRALYVVTDTATYGVNSVVLTVADRIASQLPGNRSAESDAPLLPENGVDPQAKVDLLSYPACSSPAGKTLVILGPTFSGALDSIGEYSARLAPGTPIDALCVVSSAATNATNRELNRELRRPYPSVHYVELPLTDRMKLAHVAALAEQLLRLDPQSQVEFSNITILAESSTFGYGVCDQFERPAQQSDEQPAWSLCQQALKLYFPSSIADIRYGIQRQQEEKARSEHNPFKIPLAESNQLPLDRGTENGSEYPEGQQYPSTTASKQLALEQLLGAMKASSTEPQIVIVIATDVRDRLFLFDELRQRFPRTMFIDLSSDNLLAHPDFLHSTRGALSFGSTALLIKRDESLLTERGEQPDLDVFGCRGSPGASPLHRPPWSTWSTDYQAMLADTTTRLMDGDGTVAQPPCFLRTPEVAGRRAILQVVTLEGLAQVSQSGLHLLDKANPPGPAAFPTYWCFNAVLQLTIAGAPVFCLLIMFLWLTPLPLAPRRTHPATGVERYAEALAAVGNQTTVIANVCGVYVIVTFVVALFLRTIDHDNPVVFWQAAVILLGLWGLLRCLQLSRDAGAEGGQLRARQLAIIIIPALGAAALAATPLWWEAQQATLQDQYRPPILDRRMLVKLALDPDQGIAFFLGVAVAVTALLCLSLVLSTAMRILRRNSSLLAASATHGAELSADSGELPEELRGHLLPAPAVLLSLALVVAISPALFTRSGVRLTVFGLQASHAALAAVAATTMAALTAIFASLRVGLRAQSMAGYLHNAYLASKHGSRGETHNEGPGPWHAEGSTPLSFPVTPVLARPADAPRAVQSLSSPAGFTRWQRLLTDWLRIGRDDSEHRAAVFLLLATEVALYRWLLACAVLCALASVAIVYLFPVESDPLLMLNLILLVVAGLSAGYMATTFEGDGVMSNVLCNRPKQPKLSIVLFAFAAVPFAALAVAIAVARLPGVVDWSGGLIELLERLGLHH
jgi:hypothetical protein